MCLAVPMRVVECTESTGVVELEGIRRQVFLGFLDDVVPGDYVLIHAGCAVEKLRPEEAEADLKLLRELAEALPGEPGGYGEPGESGEPGEPGEPGERGEPGGGATLS